MGEDGFQGLGFNQAPAEAVHPLRGDHRLRRSGREFRAPVSGAVGRAGLRGLKRPKTIRLCCQKPLKTDRISTISVVQPARKNDRPDRPSSRRRPGSPGEGPRPYTLDPAVVYPERRRRRRRAGVTEGRKRSINHQHAQRDRQLRRDRRSGRCLLGRADAAVDRQFPLRDPRGRCRSAARLFMRFDREAGRGG